MPASPLRRPRNRLPSDEENIANNELFLLTDYYSLLAVFDSTVLHLLGNDFELLTYRHQGRDFRRIDAYGKVLHEILS